MSPALHLREMRPRIEEALNLCRAMPVSHYPATVPESSSLRKRRLVALSSAKRFYEVVDVASEALGEVVP